MPGGKNREQLSLQKRYQIKISQFSLSLQIVLKICRLKGNFRGIQNFWENTLNAPETILNLVENGRNFRLQKLRKVFASSKSAERNERFVSESLAELLKDNSVIEADYIPHVVTLLSVSTNASGKQRLILDLKYVNIFLYKENYPQGLKSTCKLRLK